MRWCFLFGLRRYRRRTGPGFSPGVVSLIDQPEIGLLAFLVADGDNGKDWLLQAKSEPGPCTGSRSARRYRRPKATTCAAMAARQHASSIISRTMLATLPAASFSRNKGTRFLNKYNRNAIVEIKHRPAPEHDNWNWHSGRGAHGAGAGLPRQYGFSFCDSDPPCRFLRARDALFTGETLLNGHENLRPALAESHAEGAAGSQRVLAGLEEARKSGADLTGTLPIARLAGLATH
ncbi:MAG: NDP-hexose 2,3-dehydratase family protein [Haliea sp.]|nr:NDP-hexose 2,3-dehydratase family protein [Haliea sp.]